MRGGAPGGSPPRSPPAPRAMEGPRGVAPPPPPPPRRPAPAPPHREEGPSEPPLPSSSRPRPSSYRALRSAVSTLARLDDFFCEKIGAGFFSEVFKVRHRQSGHIMVLKMNKLMSNRGNMLREVQLMNRLSHPNILRFMGVCVHQGQLHALTEYINGGNLEQLLDSPTPLPWPVRIKLALDIARGLRYLHSKGIFHRDLTSKNCLVRCEDNGYTAVVGDFGLAEKIPTYSEGGEKEPLAVVGSPYWMAPEVLRGELYNEKVRQNGGGVGDAPYGSLPPGGPVSLQVLLPNELPSGVGPREMDLDGNGPFLSALAWNEEVLLPLSVSFLQDFGLDVPAFCNLVEANCPMTFLQLAFHCCSMDPTSRPSFLEITQRLEAVLEQQLALRDASSPDQTSSNGSCRARNLPGSPVALLNGQAPQGPASAHPPPGLLSVQQLLPVDQQRLSRSQSDMFPAPSPAPAPPDSTPQRVNPFSQRQDLKGGRIKLFDTPSKSLISLTFDLPPPSPLQPGTPITPDPAVEAQCDFSQAASSPSSSLSTLSPRRCRSLPSSPEMSHRRGAPHADPPNHCANGPLALDCSRLEADPETPEMMDCRPDASPDPEPPAAPAPPPLPPVTNSNCISTAVSRAPRLWPPNGVLLNNNSKAPGGWGGSLSELSVAPHMDEGGVPGERAALALGPPEGSVATADPEEVLSCPACCLGPFGFSLASVCHRPSASSTPRYQNLNCEARSLQGPERVAPGPRKGPQRPAALSSEPSLKLPEAQS
nr:dual specificity testis-specific protein kinase 1 [Anolis sagrei ordinatus]